MGGRARRSVPHRLSLSVAELVERIELSEPTVVIAESFSGAVGIQLAKRRPDLVRQLVLVGSFISPPFGSGLMRLLGSLPFSVSPPRWALRKWLVGEDASEDLVELISRTLRQVAPAVLAHRLSSIARIDEREALRSLRTPVLTISARQDRLVTARERAELRAVLPDARHVDLDGPHLLLQARPRACAELIRAHIGAAGQERVAGG